MDPQVQGDWGLFSSEACLCEEGALCQALLACLYVTQVGALVCSWRSPKQLDSVKEMKKTIVPWIGCH